MADFTNSRMAISAILYEKWHLGCYCESTPSPPPPPPTHVKTSPERLRTHAVDYAENLWLHMHIPHYGLTVAMTYLEKIWDGWTDGGRGRHRGEIGTVGGWMDRATNAHFDDREISLWYTITITHITPRHNLVRHESSLNVPFWSCACFIFSSKDSPPEEQMCGNSLGFKLQENGIYHSCCIRTTP